MVILTISKMQKEIIQGIPFWKDKNNTLFSFELDKKNIIQLGKFDVETETYILDTNWKELYSPKLNEFRTNSKNRDRKENKLQTSK